MSSKIIKPKVSTGTMSVSLESINEHFKLVGNENEITKVADEQTEFYPDKYGWMVYSKNQSQSMTDFFEKHYGKYNGYNNIIGIEDWSSKPNRKKEDRIYSAVLLVSP